MPPPVRVGNLEFPVFRSLAGIPQITVSSLRFKSFDEPFGPIDPFSGDLGAPSNTYFPVIQVDINYKSGKNQTEDPFTFLEITGNAIGEYLHTPVPKSKWRCDTNTSIPPDEDEDPGIGGGKGIDPETNEVSCVRVPGDPEVNRDVIPPITITVPETEWTLRWPQIRFEFFRDVLIHRLRILMGRVNSDPFPILFNAEPETLLFMGYTYKQQNTWRDGEINTPPVAIEMRIVEKRILWDGVIQGHNDFWRPEQGRWCRLLVGGTNNVYKSWDFNNLFKI